MKHAQEPWCQSKTISGSKLPGRPIIMLADEHGRPIMEPPIADCGIESPLAFANARRIVACVNACAGITTEELEAYGLRLVGSRAVDATLGNALNSGDGTYKP